MAAVQRVRAGPVLAHRQREVRAATCRAPACGGTEQRTAEAAARGGSDPVLENGLSLGYNEFMARLNARRHKEKS